jgi:cupin 2 domain-containing protein
MGDQIARGNLFNGTGPPGEGSEVIEVLSRASGGFVERIVSTGQATPAGTWYDQDTDEWVVVLQGDATMTAGDERIPLGPGDWIYLPRHLKHRVERTSIEPACVWLAIHFSRQG